MVNFQPIACGIDLSPITTTDYHLDDAIRHGIAFICLFTHSTLHRCWWLLTGLKIDNNIFVLELREWESEICSQITRDPLSVCMRVCVCRHSCDSIESRSDSFPKYFYYYFRPSHQHFLNGFTRDRMPEISSKAHTCSPIGRESE